MAQRVQITVDLGAGAPIEVIRQVVDTLDTVCQFGGELHYQAAMAEAEWAILRRPTGWIRGNDYDEYVFNVQVWGDPPAFRRGRPIASLPTAILAPAISRYLEENNSTQDTVTTVESIRYSNPIEIVIGVGILTLLALETARDWHARRRVNAAIAADFENEVLARKEIRDEVVRRVRGERIPLSAAQIDELLTLDVAKAMSALGDSRFNMRQLEPGDEESDHD